MQDSLSVSGAGSKAKKFFLRTVSLPLASFANGLKRTVMRSGPQARTCSAPSSVHAPAHKDSLRSANASTGLFTREQAKSWDMLCVDKECEQPIVSRTDGWIILASRYNRAQSMVHVQSPRYRTSRRPAVNLALHHVSQEDLLANAWRRSDQDAIPWQRASAPSSFRGREPLLRASTGIVPFIPRVRAVPRSPARSLTPLPRASRDCR
ncbi:hypothetical protein T484DRAFT_1825893 [Baffinella frigidus]|nr:hypothetical protein T484DRAFT_1825893 [Cryptophyta sp. CCMP2293]